MELTDAISTVDSVRDGFLAVSGVLAALAAIMAVVRYFTGGADPNARRRLVDRCGHIFIAVVSLGLVANVVTPVAKTLMQNEVSKEIKADADSGSSWLPKVDVNGEEHAVEDGKKLAKSSNLGEALKKAAKAQVAAAGLHDGQAEATDSGGYVREMLDANDNVAKYKCCGCGKLYDKKKEAVKCADKDAADAQDKAQQKADEIEQNKQEATGKGLSANGVKHQVKVTGATINIEELADADGKVRRYRCCMEQKLFKTLKDAEKHARKSHQNPLGIPGLD